MARHARLQDLIDLLSPFCTDYESLLKVPEIPKKPIKEFKTERAKEIKDTISAISEEMRDLLMQDHAMKELLDRILSTAYAYLHDLEDLNGLTEVLEQSIKFATASGDKDCLKNWKLRQVRHFL